MALRASVTEVVRARADEVLRLVIDSNRLPEWNALITGVVLPLRDLAPGSEWVFAMRAMGKSWHSRSEVLDYDAPSGRFSYRSRTDDGNPSYGDWTWTVRADPEGSRVTVGWELHPRTFWRRTLMARMRNRQLRGEVRSSLRAVERCIT